MDNLTPMLKQYRKIKQEYPDYILFFRLGDFYEMFYEDARTASKILDLVLTARSAGKSGKAPMCGIPYHASDSYISRLIKAGRKVAICEQLEDPAVSKGIVKRDIVRLITTGTFIDDHTADTRYIMSVYPAKKGAGIAFIDSEGGTIRTSELSGLDRIAEVVSRMAVYECIFPSAEKLAVEKLFLSPFMASKKITLTECEDWLFNLDIAKKNLCGHFKTQNLSGFGIEEMPDAIRSAGGLLEYLKEINRKPLNHISGLSLYSDSGHMYISPAAVHGLELDKLADILDKTSTAMGKRTLRYWIYHPSLNLQGIKERQGAVEKIMDDSSLKKAIFENMDGIGDIEKALSRISCGYSGPVKDILAVKNLLSRIPALKETLKKASGENSLLQLEDVPELREFLERTVNPEISPSSYEGRFVKQGCDSKLDQLRSIRDNVKEWLRNLQKEEIKRTGINSLKIGYNRVFGYYIEITKANLPLVPEDYIRKQTLVNGERFITPQLKEFEDKILTAEEKILEIENRMIEETKEEILKNAKILYSIASTIGVIDTVYSLACAALENNYVKPEIDDGMEILVKNGRHPVVERLIDDFFVPNDTIMDNRENHFLIITGPNMAGKSTYIRQAAIIVIMAQTGSFVPAESAKIGLVDKVFTRIGAHDEISKGQSTFMVEMTETAGIVNNLSGRSLLVLDEIGRGTSTYDGFSLAWAIAEHIAGTRARTLFATHFHELTGLAQKNSGVKNYNVAVSESGSAVSFLHKIMPGGTDESYGIYVAQLAGIPDKITRRANEILDKLELQGTLQESIIGEIKAEMPSLFEEKEKSPYKGLKEDIEKLKSLREKILSVDLENTPPVEVSMKLHKIQEDLKNGKD
ncbi:MAG TPA: DNA mismatch repair protein MutS [bacterium]|nr:DNA mismatch repair protein MutS [bacterium]